jgi:hypothetical protein
MTGRHDCSYLDLGDRHATIAKLLGLEPAPGYDPPRRCIVVTSWGKGRGPRNVAVRYDDDGSMAVLPFFRRLRRDPPLPGAPAGT